MTHARLTLRASSAVSGSSAGGRPQSASAIGAGCVTVRNTTSGSRPAKGSGDEEADRDLERERDREAGSVTASGIGEAVRRRFRSGVLSLSLFPSRLLLRSRSSPSRERRRRSRSSLLRSRLRSRLRSLLRCRRSSRRGDLERSEVSCERRLFSLPFDSLRLVNRCRHRRGVRLDSRWTRKTYRGPSHGSLGGRRVGVL